MEKIKLEFNLEDLKGVNLLIEDDCAQVVEAQLDEIRKDKYCKFYIGNKVVWLEREEFEVLDILK